MSIDNILNILKRNFRLLIIGGLIGAILSLLVATFFIKPSYVAETKLFIGKEKFINTSEEYTSEELTLYQKMVETYSEYLTSKDFMREALKDIKLEADVNKIKKNIKIEHITKTQLINISISDNNPQTAYDIVYAIANKFCDSASTLYANSHVAVVEQPYIKVKSSGTSLTMMIIISFIVGVVAMIALILVKLILDDTISDKKDLKVLTGVPCIGVIPDENKQ